TDRAEPRPPQSGVSLTSSELHSIRGSFDLMAKSTPEDWSNISTRLSAVPAALSDYRQTLLARSDAGYISANRQIAEVAAQVRAWTGQVGEGGDFFSNLAQEADVPDGLARDLAANAAKASAAYAEFGRFLDTELLPRGRDKEAA